MHLPRLPCPGSRILTLLPVKIKGDGQWFSLGTSQLVANVPLPSLSHHPARSVPPAPILKASPPFSTLVPREWKVKICSHPQDPHGHFSKAEGDMRHVLSEEMRRVQGHKSPTQSPPIVSQVLGGRLYKQASRSVSRASAPPPPASPM